MTLDAFQPRPPHSPNLPRRYPSLGANLGATQRRATGTTLVAGLLFALVYLFYLQGTDVAPDSPFGIGFALAGTGLAVLVGVGYLWRKRLRHAKGPTTIATLHIALSWHVAGGMLAVALIFMHAAGNFNSRSGTYALYGMIAVVLSGMIGRVLDRICPRLAARAALSTLNAQGEERVMVIEQQLDSLPRTPRIPPNPPPRGSSAPSASASWDLAYQHLNPSTETIQQWAARQQARQSPPVGGSAPRIGLRTMRRQVRGALNEFETAWAAEQFYVALVRTWRRLHAALCVIALGLLVWHLIYAATLVWGAR